MLRPETGQCPSPRRAGPCMDVRAFTSPLPCALGGLSQLSPDQPSMCLSLVHPLSFRRLLFEAFRDSPGLSHVLALNYSSCFQSASRRVWKIMSVLFRMYPQ